jgi:hypothetical protein
LADNTGSRGVDRGKVYLHLVDGVIIDGIIDVSGFPRAVICLLSFQTRPDKSIGGSIKRPELALGVVSVPTPSPDREAMEHGPLGGLVEVSALAIV